MKINNFWNKVNKTENCWEWVGTKRTGYGLINVDGKMVSAHRFSYMFHNSINNLGKLLVCHRCNNKGCVNPEHLYLADQSTNMKDAHNDKLVKPFYSKRDECLQGHRFTSENTKIRINKINGKPYRVCRECKRERAKQYRAS